MGFRGPGKIHQAVEAGRGPGEVGLSEREALKSSKEQLSVLEEAR
jgi:hypothetical protein